MGEGRLVGETPFTGGIGFIMERGAIGGARGLLKNSEIVCRSLPHSLEFALVEYELPSNSLVTNNSTVHIIIHRIIPSILGKQ